MRTKRSEPRRLVSFRLLEKDLELLDALAARLEERAEGVEYTRTDALRVAIRRLAQQELGGPTKRAEEVRR